jgi:hypothetical protein
MASRHSERALPRNKSLRQVSFTKYNQHLMKTLPFLLMMAAVCTAADFETGAVIRSMAASSIKTPFPGGAPRQRAVAGSLGRESEGREARKSLRRILGRRRTHVVGAKLLFSDPEKTYGDPNILVDGQRVFVFATLVNTPNRIDKAWTMMIAAKTAGRRGRRSPSW